MGRSRSRSRSRSRERREKRSRPSDDYPSSRDFDRQDSRRTFTYRPSPLLRQSSSVCAVMACAPLRPYRQGAALGWGGVACSWLQSGAAARAHGRTGALGAVRRAAPRVRAPRTSRLRRVCCCCCREIDYRGDATRGDDYRERKHERRDRSRKFRSRCHALREERAEAPSAAQRRH